MGELTITTFLSLDGIMQAPGGPEEDRSGGFDLGGWALPYFDDEAGAAIGEIFSKADAFLLGRGTYDIFAAYWPGAPATEDPVATLLNTLPKFVASRARSSFDWTGSSLLRNIEAELPALKKRFAREIQVHGSAGLAQSLIKAGLIDEYRILTFPVILGRGKRLFEAGSVPSGLRLVKSSVTSKGVVISAYRPTGKPQTGSY